MPRTRSNKHSDESDVDEVNLDDTIKEKENFTSSQMAAMMAAMQKSQSEAFERLLDRVIARGTREPLNETTSTSSPAVGPGTFTHCTARFGGDADESVNVFLDAIQSYEDCAGVSDDNALRGLSMVLVENAALWYQGVKNEIKTWQDAVSLLQSTYGDRRPPYRIYKELFSIQQGSEKTGIFIARCRALLSRIPNGDITEKAKVDMVFGLVHHRIRRRLRREDFNDFSDLLRLARQIEDAESETDAPSTSDVRTAGAVKQRSPLQRASTSAPETPNVCVPPSASSFQNKDIRTLQSLILK